MSYRGPGFKPFSHRFVQRLARGQRMGPGAYMFVAHRITAVLLTVYIYAHLVFLGSVLSGPDGFNNLMQITNNTVVRLLELGLVWIVIFHMLNGLRLVVLNLAPDTNQRLLAYGVTGVTCVVAVVSLPLFLGVR